ncbi:uncharacterized protein P884DRAFT_44528 [Thermothelomyces heterothallicus CBS 202.75]|uniref:uncharacterized protein n=1 Tax=Thermothelomyces heterothallicus CBS 202.75 TaxID=1149848 RepID=UPI003742435E
MAATERQVRISRVAGRYLVFDIDDVVYIRRHHGICAVLTGTMPQNPTQNLFLGLPVELHAEEAQLLVEKGAGYIADELTDHLSQLTTRDESTRKAYLQHLKQQRRNAQQVFDEEKAKVQAKHQGKREAKLPAATSPAAPAAASAAENEDPSSSALFSTTTPPSGSKQEKKDTLLPGVTPTTSLPLLPAAAPRSSAPVDPSTTTKLPFYRYLNSRGYYTTPGLRFGGDFSVYPGDPFRYHAHYLANSYGWDEPVAMLDLVTSGRLGTAVKKSFLFGAEKPPAVAGEDGGVEGRDEKGKGEREVRVFCIEWAGM